MSEQDDAPNPDARRDALVAAMADMPDAMPATDAPVEIDDKPAERPRDASGKFAPKVADEPATDAPEAAAPPLEPEPAWKKPPASWKAEKHAIWSGLTPEAQEYAFQREEEMRAGVEPLKSKAQIADQFQQTIAPYEQTIRSLGIEPIQAVKELMEADRLLRTLPPEQKLPYLANLARAYGINLAMGEQGPVMEPQHPVINTLQNELTNLRGTLHSLTQQQEEARTQALQSEINSFAADHPHFDQLRETMQQLLQGGAAQTLQDAYEKASRLDPDISAKIAAEKAAAGAAEKARIAQAAKAAAVSPRSSTPGSMAAPKATDRRAALEEAFNSAEGRF